jgi:hypothetical protein
LAADIASTPRQFSVGLIHRSVAYTSSDTVRIGAARCQSMIDTCHQSTTLFPVPRGLYEDPSCGFFVAQIVNAQGEQ